MPASIIDLYAVTERIEEAIADVLATATGVPVSKGLDDGTLETPRIQVELDRGKATGHKYPCPDGTIRDDSWEGTLALRIFTALGDETETAANMTQHRLLLSQCAAAMAPGQGLFTADNLPHHQLIDCRDQSQPLRVEAPDHLYVTEISFVTITQIRATAFEEALGASGDDQILTTDEGDNLTTDEGELLTIDT